MRLFKNNKGFSLVEVLVAIVILTLVATSVLGGFVQASRVNLKSQYMQDAANLAQITSEVFNAQSLEKLMDRYDSVAMQGEGITVSTDADGVITFANIKEEYIYDGVRYDEPFLVTVKLDKRPYVSANEVKTTYNQNLYQQNLDGSDTVIRNSFLFPEIKETGGNIILTSATNTPDTKVLLDYALDAGSANADNGEFIDSAISNAVSGINPVTNPTGYAAAKSNAYEAAKEYLNTYYPSANMITAKAYTGAYANKPTRTIKMAIKVENETSDTVKASVSITADYTFPAVNYTSATYGSISVDSYTATGVELLKGEDCNFIYDKTDGTEKKDVYFYINPISSILHYKNLTTNSIVGGTAPKDTYVVSYDESAVTGTLTDKAKISVYLIAQNFVINNPMTGKDETCIPLFDESNLTLPVSGNVQFYSNFRKNDSGNLKMLGNSFENPHRPLLKGYLTDGGTNRTKLYDMEIIISMDGKEYARIVTTKED